MCQISEEKTAGNNGEVTMENAKIRKFLNGVAKLADEKILGKMELYLKNLHFYILAKLFILKRSIILQIFLKIKYLKIRQHLCDYVNNQE